MQNQLSKTVHALNMNNDEPSPGGADDAAPPENVTVLPGADRAQHLRMLEALLFAANEPVGVAALAERLPNGADVEQLLEELAASYENRGVNLVMVAGNWMFRTAEDLSFLMRKDAVEEKRLSRAALETIAIIAYHQPVTRAEVEEVRGVKLSKGTLDMLLEIGWIRMRGRRRTPGRPVTYGVTDAFLGHFGLNDVSDLPGLEDLKAAGLLDSNLPPDFEIPAPTVGEDLDADEDPFDEEELDEALLDEDMEAELDEDEADGRD